MTNEKVKEFLQTIDNSDSDNLPDNVLGLIDKVITKCQEKAPKLLYSYIQPSFAEIEYWKVVLDLCEIEQIKYDRQNDEIYLDLGERDSNGKFIFKTIKRNDVIIITPETKTEEPKHCFGTYIKSHKPKFWIMSYTEFVIIHNYHRDLFKEFEREDYPNAYYRDNN